MNEVAKVTIKSGRPNAQIERIHSPFYPAEVYLGEKIEAEVETMIGQRKIKIKMPVWRISPLGAELLITEQNRTDVLGINTGHKINLRILISKQICEFNGIVILSKHGQDSHGLIGVRWCAEEEKDRREFTERRNAKRWLCGNDFMPTGMAPNPARFNDFIHFKVRDISKNGFLLVTSLRNKYLIPGMILESSVSLPMCAQIQVKLIIRSARIINTDGKDYLALGTEILKRDPDMMDSIGQYIFQFGPKTTISELRQEGFLIKRASHGLEFSFVQNGDEYNEVLALRRLAYSQEGKMQPDVPLEELADIYDTRSRILIARHRGQIVGSIRLMFHNPEDTFEQEEFVQIPDSFPRKDESVEITRFCTHPDFRKSDVFHAMVRQMIITLMQSRRRYFVTGASGPMIKVYEKLGATLTGVKYRHGDLGDAEHELIVFDVPKAISGEGVNPILWNIVFADMTRYLVSESIIEYQPVSNVRMAFYRMFRPFAYLKAGITARKKRA